MQMKSMQMKSMQKEGQEYSRRMVGADSELGRE
jgi:hypothetical protein